MKFNNINDLVKNLQKAADNISGNVPFPELFTDSFLKQNTKFSSFDEFEADPFFENNPDFDAIPEESLDAFINEISDFSNWKDFAQSAANQYAKRKLGF